MYPTPYFTEDGRAIEGAVGSELAFRLAAEESLPAEQLSAAIRVLNRAGLVVTLADSPLTGAISRVKVEAHGVNAGEVQETLVKFAYRVDPATDASECALGRCVIERDLTAMWGGVYGWRGALTMHPSPGIFSPDVEGNELQTIYRDPMLPRIAR